MSDEGTYVSRFVRASDGLTLHVRVYGAAPDRAWPVVCLPGLTRNAQDFHTLARLLATHPERPRRVLALDYRGRGLSARDPDWRNYDIQVEMNDVLALLAALGVGEAAFVGTSRGGLITMALAAARPALLKAVVLNDIGPVIDGKGLIRIRGYVGKLPKPKSWDEAIDALQRLQGAQFPGLDREGWMVARPPETWHRAPPTGTAGSSRYDRPCMKTFESRPISNARPRRSSASLRTAVIAYVPGCSPSARSVSIRDLAHQPATHGGRSSSPPSCPRSAGRSSRAGHAPLHPEARPQSQRIGDLQLSRRRKSGGGAASSVSRRPLGDCGVPSQQLFRAIEVSGLGSRGFVGLAGVLRPACGLWGGTTCRVTCPVAGRRRAGGASRRPGRQTGARIELGHAARETRPCSVPTQPSGRRRRILRPRFAASPG